MSLIVCFHFKKQKQRGGKSFFPKNKAYFDIFYLDLYHLMTFFELTTKSNAFFLVKVTKKILSKKIFFKFAKKVTRKSCGCRSLKNFQKF